jgi:hypothetical protein
LPAFRSFSTISSRKFRLFSSTIMSRSKSRKGIKAFQT